MSTSINPRMRPRIAVSIGSIQLSKRRSSVSFCSNGESDFVVALVMAWSPVRRVNAGRFEVKHPGDYATFNSNHSRDATLVVSATDSFGASSIQTIHVSVTDALEVGQTIHGGNGN